MGGGSPHLATFAFMAHMIVKEDSAFGPCDRGYERNGDFSTVIKSAPVVILARMHASGMIPAMLAFRWVLFVTLAFSIASGQEGGQSENDPHRPPCTNAQCRKVKSFIKTHYCGAPQGNGPDDSCEIRQPKKHLNAEVKANYYCKWIEGVRNCKQQGEPSSEIRDIVVGKLRGLGLPAKPKGQIYFAIWQPIGFDWSLVEAYYDHTSGSDLTLCELIAIIDKNSQVSVLRKVPFQKTDADKNTVTTWSALDLADVNADGQIEVILEGDAYEDHWIEVVGMKDGSFKTIFSGLGYYL
jgi:hypothetical protein